jgi:hypothetical protein
MKLGSHGRRFATRPAAMLLGAAVLVGCAKSHVDKTALEVRVTSELAVPAALDQIVVRVQTAPNHVKDYPFKPLVRQGVGYTLPLSLSFTPNGDPTLPFEVDVTGLLGTSEVIFRAFKVSGFVSGELRVLNVALTAACVGKHCVEGQTCAAELACGFQPISPKNLPATETVVGGDDAGAGAGGPDGAAGAGQSGHDGAAPDAVSGGGAGGNGGSTGGASGTAGAAAGASGMAGGGAGGAGTGGGGAGGSDLPKCINSTRTCGDNEQPQLCVAGAWQNDGAACAEPVPLCSQGACACAKTRCPTVCTDLSNDPHNCGHCGHDCLAGKCLQSQCLAFSIATATNRPVFIAVDAQNVYWSESNYNDPNGNGGTIMKVSLAGGAAIKMASTSTFVSGIASDGTYVYWGTATYNTNIGSLFKLGINSPTGTTPTTVATDQDEVGYPVLVGGFVYWAEPSGGAINKVSLNGGPITTLAMGPAKPSGLAVDASSVYWTTNDDGTVMKVGLNGGTPQTLATNQLFPYEIVVGAPNVYWMTGDASRGNATLMKVGTGGGTPTPVSSSDGSEGLIADATNL